MSFHLYQNSRHKTLTPVLNWRKNIINTVKPVYKDQPRETRKMVLIGRWSLCTGSLSACFNEKPFLRGTKNVVFVDRWSFYTVGHQSRFDCSIINYHQFTNFTHLFHDYLPGNSLLQLQHQHQAQTPVLDRRAGPPVQHDGLPGHQAVW